MVNAPVAALIPAALLAHQGGWDEMLLVVGPIGIVAGLLALARRRVIRAAEVHEPRHDEPADTQ